MPHAADDVPEQEKINLDTMTHHDKPVWKAMRGGFGGWTRWNEEEQIKTDIRECTDQHCLNVEVNCGFQGLDPDSPLSQSAAVSDTLRAAWKAKLEREGKPTSGTQSLRDIVFGSER
jgi:hypothetical protein